MRIRALLLSLAVLVVGALAATFLTSTGASGAVAVTAVKPFSANRPCSTVNVARYCEIASTNLKFAGNSSTTRPVGYWKGADELVHVQGMARATYVVSSGGENPGSGVFTVFYLPKEMRPTKQVRVPALECTSYTPTWVAVDPDGRVSASMGSNQCIDFDGVSFRR